MECYEAEELVSGYINHTLNEGQMEDFIRHVRSCPSCYDELEMHFIVNEALNQLSVDAETDLDFKILLEQDLKKSELHLIRQKLQRAVVIFTVLFLAVAAVGLILLKYYG